MTTTHVKSAFFLIVLITISGCASQPPLIKKTVSGFPEGVFKNTTKEEVFGKLIDLCSKAGLTVSTSQQNQIVCTKKMTGGDALLAQIFVGNAYSTPPVMKLSFLVYKINNSIKVTAHQWVESQMAFGQIRKADLKDNKHNNDVQNALFKLGAE